MKWGSRYNHEFVNRLYNSILKHTKNKTRLICFTDDIAGINNNVICNDLPHLTLPKQISMTPWRKVSVWQEPLLNLSGDVLFLDLDLVVTGNLDKFFEFKKTNYCVIENWTQKGKSIGNTSCFRFNIGKHKQIFDNFQKSPITIWKKYHIEQVYISKEIESQYFWPEDWCQSFKHSLLPSWPMRIWKPAKLPQDTSIVAFTGKPDPDDVLKGIWPVPSKQFYKKIYKRLKTPKWLSDNWKN